MMSAHYASENRPIYFPCTDSCLRPTHTIPTSKRNTSGNEKFTCRSATAARILSDPPHQPVSNRAKAKIGNYEASPFWLGDRRILTTDSNCDNPMNPARRAVRLIAPSEARDVWSSNLKRRAGTTRQHPGTPYYAANERSQSSRATGEADTCPEIIHKALGN